jgi:hypothetical protein
VGLPSKDICLPWRWRFRRGEPRIPRPFRLIPNVY